MFWKAGVCSWLLHHDTLLPEVLGVQSPCRASAADEFPAAASAFWAVLVLTGLVSAVNLSKQYPGDKTKSGMHVTGWAEATGNTEPRFAELSGGWCQKLREFRGWFG